MGWTTLLWINLEYFLRVEIFVNHQFTTERKAIRDNFSALLSDKITLYILMDETKIQILYHVRRAQAQVLFLEIGIHLELGSFF